FQCAVGGEGAQAALADPLLALALALVQVRAATERRAVSADEYELDCRVRGDAPNRFDQLVAHLQVERVAHLRAIERDHRDTTFEDLELDRHMALVVLSFVTSSFDRPRSSSSTLSVCSPSAGGRPISGLSLPRH